MEEPKRRMGRPNKKAPISYKKEKVKQKNYLNETDLVYQIIISKGLGKPTQQLEVMLILIATKLSLKFSYRNYSDKIDCQQEGIYQLFKRWTYFDEHKYEHALPFLTEIAKRSMANCFNTLRGQRNVYDKYIPKFVHLGNWDV